MEKPPKRSWICWLKGEEKRWQRARARTPYVNKGAIIHRPKTVNCVLPKASCGKLMNYTVRCPVPFIQWKLHFPCAGCVSYPFVDSPPGNTLRCKLFPSDKFTKSVRTYPAGWSEKRNLQTLLVFHYRIWYTISDFEKKEVERWLTFLANKNGNTVVLLDGITVPIARKL